MTPTPALIDLPGQARLLACSDDHARRWVLAHLVDAPRARIMTVPGRLRHDCAQCSWCGATVVTPAGPCLRHDDACPGSAWTASQHALEAVEGALYETGLAELPPAAWDALTAAAARTPTDIPRLTAVAIDAVRAHPGT